MEAAPANQLERLKAELAKAKAELPKQKADVDREQSEVNDVLDRIALLEELIASQSTTPPPVVLPDPKPVDPPPVVTPPTPKALKVLQPDYDVATNKGLFNYEGGDGTPVKFMAPGATGWTEKREFKLDTGAWMDGKKKNSLKIAVYIEQSGKQSGPFSFDLIASGTAPAPEPPPVVIAPDPVPVTPPKEDPIKIDATKKSPIDTAPIFYTNQTDR